VKSGFLLNVVVRESAAVFELLASEDKTLLVRWDTLLILDLRLYIVDSVRRLDLKSDGLSSKGLDEDLHATTETEDEMEGRLLLDVVVGQCSTILELLAGEDEALLVWRDTLLILNLRLDVIDGVGRLNLEGDRLAGKGLDEDLHATTETEDQVQSRFLLNIVI
jgi:hypothetical protein